MAEPIEIEDFLAHYGVSGMKWGVRRAALTKENRRMESLKKVSEGTAKSGDRLRVGLLRSKKSASKQLSKAVEREKRVESGKAKARDIFALYGTLSAGDLMVQGKAKAA